jgi:hypothetical protein
MNWRAELLKARKQSEVLEVFNRYEREQERLRCYLVARSASLLGPPVSIENAREIAKQAYAEITSQ